MFDLIGYAVLAVGVLLVLGFIFNRQAIVDFWNAGRAQYGKAGRAALKADSHAVLLQRIDDRAQDVRKAEEALATSKSLVIASTRSVQEGEAEVTTLTNRIQSVLAKGDPNNSAKEYALKLDAAEQKLARDRQQLKDRKESYDTFLSKVENAKKQLLDARQRAEDLGHQLAQSQEEKKLAEFEAKTSPMLSDTDFSDVEDTIQRQIDENRAVGEVSRDLNRTAYIEKADEELERDARADEILARYQKPGATETANETV